MKYLFLKKICASLVLFVGIFSALHVEAAKFYFNVPQSAIKEGEQFRLELFLDTENQNINTLGLDIVLPSEVDFISSDQKDSFIPYWVEAPHVLKNSHTVRLASMIPGGFAGYIDPFNPSVRKVGLVVGLNLKATKSGFFDFALINAHSYLNDGKGTEVSVSRENVRLQILADSKIKQRVDLSSVLYMFFVFAIFYVIMIAIKWLKKKRYLK